MSTEQTIADLKATKEQMTPFNWCPTGPSNGRGQRCVIVHLSEVIKRDQKNWQIRFSTAANAMSKHTPEDNVGKYNDDPDTTFADIQNLIDKTLADLGGL